MIARTMPRSGHGVLLRRALIAALALCGLAGGAGGDGAAPSSEAIGARVEPLIRAFLARHDIPGMGVAVAYGGRVWEAGFGLADVENEVPVTPRTVFRYASLSKPITAVAVMRLAEQGKIDLDAPIRRYVAQWPEKPYAITPRQLLGHLGGIRWYRGPFEMASTWHFRSLRDSLRQFQNDPLECEPGTRFLYSTYGYTLLGLAIEGTGGRPFVEDVKAAVFDPAGMASTRDDDCEAIIPHRAAGYRRTPSGRLLNSPPSDCSGKVPGGGLCGTAGDLVRFAEAFHGGRLVKPETAAVMTTEQRARDGKPTGYGLGWNLSRRGGRAEVWHGGGQPKVSSMLYTRPEGPVAVALLGNLEGVPLLELAREVADAVEAEAGP